MTRPVSWSARACFIACQPPASASNFSESSGVTVPGILPRAGGVGNPPVFIRFPRRITEISRRVKTIAVANQKGGVGKTTTSVNLGSCLAAEGRAVLLIDLDPQANATSALGLEVAEGMSLYGPLLGEELLADKVLPTRFERLFIVPADIDLAGAEIEVARLEDHLARLRMALAPLASDAPFDFVLIDCPPSLGILMTNALAAADELLVPIQCEYFALEGLSKIDSIVGQIRDCGANPELKIGGILMTMFMRNNLAHQVIGEVQKHFGE